MGLFSFTCGLSNVEIANDMIDMPKWMSDIVVQLEDGTIHEGSYDGYGRIKTADEVVNFYEDCMEAHGWQHGKVNPRVVIKRAYEECKEPYNLTEIPRGGDAEYQGHFFPEEYLEHAGEMVSNLV